MNLRRVSHLEHSVELRHPAGGEVTVLQDDPAALLVRLVDQGLRAGTLALAQGNGFIFLLFVLRKLLQGSERV